MYDNRLPTHPGAHIVSYADDITIFSQHPEPGTAAAHLQEYIYTLEEWLQTNSLKISPTKSTLALITPWSCEYTTQITVTLNNTPIPYTNTPTTLGVTYDKGMTFG